jgi:cobalt-zinc-cadmium efflux system outer membrane protein
MSFKPAHAALAACLTCAALTPAHAETPALTLEQALARARGSHPALQASAFEMRAQDARARQAGLRPATTVELLVEDAGGSGTRAGMDAAQTTLSLSHLLELGGKRRSRLAVAEAQGGGLRTAQAVRQLDVMAEIARRFVAVLALQERVEDTAEGAALAQRVQEAVGQRVRAAAAPEAELSRAIVATAEAELELEDARHTLATARVELAAAMGLRAPDFASVSGALFTAPAAPSLDALVTQLEAAPDLLRFADEARLREAEARLAHSQAGYDVRLTAGVRQFQQDDGTAFIGGLSVPLFAGGRAAPGRAAAEAERDKVALDREGALLKARALLTAHYSEMEHARHVMEALRDRVLPQLGKALEQTEYAYRRGRYSYLEWSDAQRRHLDARARYIASAAEFHTHRIEIERLAGQDMNLEGEAP